MAEPLRQDCGTCAGTGTVPRERRKMENGEPDPLDDFRREETCSTCGGGGKVPLDKARVVEKGAGWIADHI